MTQQAQHTPGSWYIDERSGRTKILSEEDGSFVADCDDGFHNDNGEWCPSPHMMPNARLIAAAPNLLAALIEIDQAFQAAMPTHCEYPQGTFEIVQAAIAKATGEVRS